MMWLHKLRPFLVVLILTILPVLFSCNVLNSPQEELLPIEGTIFFSVQEGYTSYYSVETPRIRLTMITEKQYPNYNYEIRHKVTIFGNIISVKLNGIYKPPILLHAFGPATASSFLELSEGEYSLHFSDGSFVDQYRLTVTGSSIKVTKILARFTIPTLELYLRYPANSMAYLCGTNGPFSWIHQDFLDTLLSKIHLTEFQFPDSGIWPYPSLGVGSHYYTPTKFFYYETEEDFDKAGEILKTYIQTVLKGYEYETFAISLIGWNNKVFKSW